ncbi:MAG: exo-alpha-sialidase [Owenweeksia sp.]
MKKTLLILFAPFWMMAQYPNVELGFSIGQHRGLSEPSIAVSKTNPANQVAGSILDQVFYSSDSGKTWTRDTLKSTYGVWGDPVLISDYDGNFYFLHLSDPTGENWQSEEILDRIVCQQSKDNGKTWNNGGYMGLHHPKDQDKQWCVAGEDGTLYTTWTQFDDYGSKDSTDRTNILFSRSDDGGLNWSESMVISQHSGDCLDGDQTTEGAVPAVTTDGTVYVAWANNYKIYFDRSKDGGKTWLAEDKIVADQPGGWEIDIPGLMRANGMPVTVVNNKKGKYQGEIYVNWVDDRNGHYDVWFARSTDGGDSWSEARKVNDDDTETDQFFTWLSCDQTTGYLYCIFYDRRNYNDLQTDVYMAVSKDGGRSWTNEKISEKPFKPNPNVFFGDYNHIDAHNGVVRPIWTRYDLGGRTSIWTALINKKD